MPDDRPPNATPNSKDNVERLRKPDPARVHDAKFQVGEAGRRKRRAGEFDHFREASIPITAPFRQSTGDFGRHFPIAAADIQEMLVAAQFEFSDQFARPGLLRG